MSGCYEYNPENKVGGGSGNNNSQLDVLEEKIKEIESHINKLHDMINIEDRITACDVLNRLTKIENCFSSVIESGKKIKISEYKSVAKNCTICEGIGILEGQYDCPKCLGKGKYI